MQTSFNSIGLQVYYSWYCRSVNWSDEELHQLVKEHRACFAQGLDNDHYINGVIT